MSADRVWLDPAIIVPLVRAAQESGDPAHVERLLGALRPMLMRKLGHRQPPEVAEDLVQVALAKIARSYADMRPAEAVATGYLVRLVRNVLLDHARTTRRAERANERVRAADPPRDTDRSDEIGIRALELRELVVAVRQAVERLPSSKLRAVVLGYLRELTPEEIGAELGITPDNVRVRWARAKRLLRSDLANVASEWGLESGLIPPPAVGRSRAPCAETPQPPNESSVRPLGWDRGEHPEAASSGVRGVG